MTDSIIKLFSYENRADLMYVDSMIRGCNVRNNSPLNKKIFKIHQQLNREEKEVIKFLAEKQGNAFEAEIREHFPDLPRTSLWRLVRRLEKLEIVKVKKIGNENRVELRK